MRVVFRRGIADSNDAPRRAGRRYLESWNFAALEQKPVAGVAAATSCRGVAYVESSRNPIRLLLHLPVPWVFVLVYLIGVAVERAGPTHLIEHVPYLGVAGGVVFGIGAAHGGWGRVTFL